MPTLVLPVKCCLPEKVIGASDWVELDGNLHEIGRDEWRNYQISESEATGSALGDHGRESSHNVICIEEVPLPAVRQYRCARKIKSPWERFQKLNTSKSTFLKVNLKIKIRMSFLYHKRSQIIFKNYFKFWNKDASTKKNIYIKLGIYIYFVASIMYQLVHIIMSLFPSSLFEDASLQSLAMTWSNL